MGNNNLMNMLIPTTIVYFISSRCELNAEEFNEEIRKIYSEISEKPNSRFKKNKLKLLLSFHDCLCSKIKEYNHYCSKFYFINFIIFIPITILLLIILFKLSNFIWFFILFYVLTLAWTMIFFISYESARLNKSVHASSKIISQIQWHLKKPISLKIKLLSTFERINEKKRIIGFSVLDLFVMNFYYFAWMVIIYCRFVILYFRLHDY